MKTRIALLTGIAAGALLSSPAFAQDDARRTSPCRPTPPPAASVSAVPENVIIITARRRDGSSRRTCRWRSPRSTGGRSTRPARSACRRSSSSRRRLQVYSSNPRNTAVNIRGIGVPFGLTNDGFEQGVGIYVDDVYYSRAGLGDVRLPRRRPGRSAARAAGHALRQEHHRRRDQHHAPTSRPSTSKAAPRSRSATTTSSRPRRRSRARCPTRVAARIAVSATEPPRHDLQRHQRQLDQRAGQPRRARPAAVPAERQPRCHPGRRLQRAESRMLRHRLRRLRPDPARARTASSRRSPRRRTMRPPAPIRSTA